MTLSKFRPRANLGQFEFGTDPILNFVNASTRVGTGPNWEEPHRLDQAPDGRVYLVLLPGQGDGIHHGMVCHFPQNVPKWFLAITCTIWHHLEFWRRGFAWFFGAHLFGFGSQGQTLGPGDKIGQTT